MANDAVKHLQDQESHIGRTTGLLSDNAGQTLQIDQRHNNQLKNVVQKTEIELREGERQIERDEKALLSIS